MTTRLALVAALVVTSAPASVIVSPGTVLANSLGELLATTGIDKALGGIGLTPTTYVSGTTAYTTGTSLDDIGDPIFRSSSPTGFINFDLGQEFYLVGLAVWNFQDASALNAFNVWSSPDNSFASLSLLGSGNAVKDTPSGRPYVSQLFSLSSPATTQFVRFEVVSNFGTSSVSFAELAFEADTAPPPVATPEPSSFVLLALGGLAFLLWVRRRRGKGSTIPS